MKLENQLVSNNIGEIFDSGLVDYKVRNYVMTMMMVTIIISILKKILLDQKRIKKERGGYTRRFTALRPTQLCQGYIRHIVFIHG